MTKRHPLEPTANVYLLGMMGSGKTTLGKMLAARLRRPFLDTDELVEARAGSSIPELFTEEGEARFRTLETECLLELGREQGLVVALGGGTVTREPNRHVIQAGYSIYLSARAETLMARLAEHPERPLLAGMDALEKLQALRRLLALREPYYLQADLVVENEGPPWEALERIVQALAREGLS